MLILKQNAANTVPTPAAGKGTIFLSDSDVLSVKNSSGNVEAFPTIGGANTQVIFNDDSALSGSANYTFDKSTNVLTVAGNIGATRVLTDNLLYANGDAWDLTQPAGSNTEIQYNDGAGGFGASSNFTFDEATNTLTVIGEVSATTLAGSLTTAAQTNITSVGTLTALTVNGNAGVTNLSATGEVAGDSLSISSDAVIGGNLNVNGNLTYVNVESFAVEDPIISMGGGPNGAPLTSNDGKDRGTDLQYYDGQALQAFMGWDNSNAEFGFGSDVSLANEVVTFNTYGNIRAGHFIGNGSALTDLVGSEVDGEVGFAAVANSVAGSNVSGQVAYAGIANSVAGGNVSGQVGNALVAGEVYESAQPNITSVGTLTSLDVGANASIGTFVTIADGNIGDFAGSKLVSSYGDTGVTLPDWAGIVGAAVGNSANANSVGTGVIGVGSTSGGTRGSGVKGIAVVSNSTDTGAAVGVRGQSVETHASGYNIGLLGAASNSSINNYALYLQEGNIGSIEEDVNWDLFDNSGTALTFGSSGKANIFLIETTDNAEGIATSGYLNVTGNATVGGLKTDNLYYANGNPWDLQEAAGSNTNIQYNNNGDFGASANFTFNSATGVFSAPTIAGTLSTAAQTNITSVGTLTSLDVTGNVSAGNVSGTDGDFTTVAGSLTTAAQPNITSVGTLSSLAVSGNASAGNISATAGDFTSVSGNGSALTAITGANVTGEVAFADTANAVAGANVSGEVSFAAVANSVAGGNVSGEVAFADTANAVAGANVSGTVSSATTAGTVTTAAQPNITSVGTLTGLGVNGTLTAVDITANTGVFTGDAGGLSNVVGANVTGEVSFAATANAVAGANVSGTVSSATSATSATTAGTVTTAAQPNITSVGTLSSLTTTGNVDTTANVVTDDIIGKTGGVTITAIGTNQPISLVTTGTGSVDVNSARITEVGTPTASTDAATKQYVDDIAQGLHVHKSCQVATTGTLTSITGGTITYNNGSSGVGATLTTSSGNFDTIDGQSVTNGDRILVKDETTAANNGIYVKTSSTVLTRADDFDTPTELAGGDFTFVSTGTLYNDTGWVMTDPVATIGTDPVNFVQFSGAGTYTAGTGLTLTGTEFSITDTAVSAASYGNGTHNATFTVNARGQLTAAANVAITANAAALTGTVLNSSVVTSSLTSVGTLGTLDVTGNVDAGNVNATTGAFTSVTGSGSGLTSLNASNLSSGTVPSGRLSGTYTITVSGSATTAGTVTTAAQPNITSVGSLSSLDVTGNATAANVIADTGAFYGSGSGLTSLNASNISSGTLSQARLANSSLTVNGQSISLGGSGTITASTTQSVTFNNGGSGAASGTTFNGGTARTISYNTIGAPSTTGTNASGTWGISVTGSASSATTAGTVTTAAQPNITSVGTLSSLTASGQIQGGSLRSTTLTTGSNSTAGSITGDWTLTSGSTLNATYADLAEKYTADQQYEPGTVVCFGGDAELSITGRRAHHSVAGVITTNPAQVYNAECKAGEGEFVVDLALIGRVPVRVIGPVVKGDLIITSENAGFGCAADLETDTLLPGCIIGKAISDFNGPTPEGIVEVLVGKN